MRVMMGLLVLGLVPPLMAADFDEQRVLVAVDKIAAEYRVYATCLSLDAAGYDGVRQIWRMQVERGMAELNSLKASMEFAQKVGQKLSPAELVDGNMKLSEAIAYCAKNQAQLRTYMEFGFSSLDDAIRNAATSKTAAKP